MDDYSMPFPSSATFLSLLGVQRFFPIVFPRLSISTNPLHPQNAGKSFSAL